MSSDGLSAHWQCGDGRSGPPMGKAHFDLQKLHGARTGARSGKASQSCRYNHGKTMENVVGKGVLMAAELREAPDVVARQMELLVRPLGELAAVLKRRPPRVVVTCARGSSAHAANFGKHLIERHLGIPVAAVAPSIMTIYRQGLRLKRQLFLAISQSGRSDDLVEAASSARAFGALTAAIVNDTDSPLASTCDIVLPMAAGPELSVAATKTFVASIAILLNLTAYWAAERAIKAALDRLPERLAVAAELDWAKAVCSLSRTNSLATLGRGPTLAIAQEASLKLKEVQKITWTR